MAELTEKELLLLSNYMYMDKSVEKVNIEQLLASMRDTDGNIDPALLPKASGGMEQKEIEMIFREMNGASDEFKSLTVTEVLNGTDIRVACFESAGGDATVVFRGTGGTYEAWTDNLMGGMQTDTGIQKQAADFIQKECGRYNNLTVTGHSKGGNLAQYVTVKCPNQIDRCVSYDGQGQNIHFIRSNAAAVREAQGKIKSISAHNDFVNILLTSIAGRRIFVENKGMGIEAHKSTRLLSDNEFDPETGKFLTICKQDNDMAVLQGLLANGVTRLDEFPYGVRQGVYQTIAGITADILATDRSLKYKAINTGWQMMQLQQAIGTPESEGFEVDLSRLQEAGADIEASERGLSDARAIVDGMDGLLFKAFSEKIEKEHRKLKKINTAAENILVSYRMGENEIISYCNAE